MFEIPLRKIQYKIRKEVYDQKFGHAYKVSCLMTFFGFIFTMILYLNTPSIPVGVFKIIVMQPQFEASSLAMTSIIMILYNFFAWVGFTQRLCDQTKFSDVENEMDRALLLISELEQVCAYCTTLKQLMENKKQKPDQKTNQNM